MIQRLSAVYLVCWLLLVGVAAAPRDIPSSTTPLPTSSPGLPAVADALSDPVREALTKGNYPWYDSISDRVKPVNLTPPRETPGWIRSIRDGLVSFFGAIDRFFSSIGQYLGLPTVGSLGNAVPIALIVLGVVIIALALFALWKSSFWQRGDQGAEGSRVRKAARIKLLPGGLADRPMTDPWNEVIRRRNEGDYSGAVVYLFAHQIMELDRLGFIRLMPGLTGRTYVIGVKDSNLKSWVTSTLGLFEQSYYGHKRISATMFEPVWAHAQSFQSYVRTLDRGMP